MGTTTFSSYVNNNTGFVTGSEIFSGARVGIFNIPSQNQVGYFKTVDSIQGNDNLIFDGSSLTVTGTVDATTVIGANVTTGADPGHTHTTITIADESTDTTCFPLFATAATGTLQPKSGTNLTFNSSSGLFTVVGNIFSDVPNGDITVGDGTGAAGLNVNSATGSGAELLLWSGSTYFQIWYAETAGFTNFNNPGGGIGAKFNDGTSVDLYYNNSKVFETTATGIDVTGIAVVDGLTSSSLTNDDGVIFTNASGTLENSASFVYDGSYLLVNNVVIGGNALSFESFATHGTISHTNDFDIQIKTGETPETNAIFHYNGSVDLYHNNVKTLETLDDGIKITGDTLQMSTMKSGVDQAGAGAAAGELYFDTNDDNTVKMGV